MLVAKPLQASRTSKAQVCTWGSGWLGLRSEARWGRVASKASQDKVPSGVSLGLLGDMRPEEASAILPKWFLLTRLETRTKESNTYASVLVEKPTRVMKVSDAKRKRQHQPTMILW